MSKYFKQKNQIFFNFSDKKEPKGQMQLPTSFREVPKNAK